MLDMFRDLKDLSDKLKTVKTEGLPADFKEVTEQFRVAPVRGFPVFGSGKASARVRKQGEALLVAPLRPILERAVP